MDFGSDPELEALIGRVCLVFARVEQEAGQVVQAARGNWALAGSRDYLKYSSVSSRLLEWLKGVARAYPEVEDDVTKLSQQLRTLKKSRDRWAHSAAITDVFLLMIESGTGSMDFPAPNTDGTLLNSKTAGHFGRLSAAAVEDFSASASDAGDAASELAVRIAQLVDDGGVRPLREPG